MGLLDFLRRRAQNLRVARYVEEYDGAVHRGLTETEAGAEVIMSSWNAASRRGRIDFCAERIRHLAGLLGGKVEIMQFLEVCHRHGITKFVANSIILDVFYDSHGGFFLAAGPLMKRATGLLDALLQRLKDGPLSTDEAKDIVMLAHWASVICPKNPTGWYCLAFLDKLGARRLDDPRDFIFEGLKACDEADQLGEFIEQSTERLRTLFSLMRTGTLEELLSELGS